MSYLFWTAIVLALAGLHNVWMLCADRHRKCGGWLAPGGCASCGKQPRFWEREL